MLKHVASKNKFNVVLNKSLQVRRADARVVPPPLRPRVDALVEKIEELLFKLQVELLIFFPLRAALVVVFSDKIVEGET